MDGNESDYENSQFINKVSSDLLKSLKPNLGLIKQEKIIDHSILDNKTIMSARRKDKLSNKKTAEEV
jgi:hypothetical protein